MWSLRLIRRTAVNMEKLKGVWHEAFPQEKDIARKFELGKVKALEDRL